MAQINIIKERLKSLNTDISSLRENLKNNLNGANDELDSIYSFVSGDSIATSVSMAKEKYAEIGGSVLTELDKLIGYLAKQLEDYTISAEEAKEALMNAFNSMANIAGLQM